MDGVNATINTATGIAFFLASSPTRAAHGIIFQSRAAIAHSLSFVCSVGHVTASTTALALR